MIYDVDARTFWDRDTASLPWVFRRLRRRYRAFAADQIAPRAIEADADPHAVDVPTLFLAAAARGFATEFLPWPWGTMHPVATARSLLLGSALKAEEFCAACGGLGLSVLAHELGIAPLFVCGELRVMFGKLGRIYREIRRGQPSIAAFAITEPGAGSDVEDTAGAGTAAVGCRAVRTSGGWRISGRKCFISDGAVARYVTLFAATDGGGVESWTCFLLDKSMEGLSVGRRERKLGQRAADASELILDDVFVPDERVVGKVGAGWAINRNVLNFSRPVVGAIALGIARGALEHTVGFCRTARLGGRPLASYQDVQIRLADMLMKVQAMRATVWQAVRYPLPFQAAGAIAKAFCGDLGWEVCNEAIDLLGDHGTVCGRGVEKAARDMRLNQIYEGTNQINRLAIFEGQADAEFSGTA